MSLDELPQWAAFLLPWEPRNAPDRAIGEITTAEEQAWLRKYSKEPNREGRDELARSLTAIQVATTGDAHLGRHPTATREVARLLSLTRRGSIKLDLIDAIEELRSALVGVKPKGGADFDRFVADAIALRVKEDSALTIDLSLVPEIPQDEWDRREAERVTRITDAPSAGSQAGAPGPVASLMFVLEPGDIVLDHPMLPVPLWGTPEDCLAARGEPTMIYGKTGIGKTTVMHRVMLSMVGIGPSAVLGYDVQPMDDDRRILYLAYDRPSQALRSIARMVTENDRPQLAKTLVIDRKRMLKVNSKDTLNMRRLCEENNIGRVFIDSLKDIATRLSEDESGAAYNAMVQEAIVADIEVFTSHHPRKGQGESKRESLELDDVYGSTWLTAGQGSIIVMDGEAGASLVFLRQLKMPSGEVGPFAFRIDYSTGELHREPTGDIVAMLAAVPGYGWTPTAVLVEKLYGESTNTSRTATRRRLERLVTSGKVEQRPLNQKEKEWRLTDEARADLLRLTLP